VRVELWRLFGQLAAGGTTLLISSHSLEEARHCDELLLLRDGRILLADSPDGLRDARSRRPRGRIRRDHRRARGGPGMTACVTLAITRRVLGQLRHDPRTLALLILVPALLMTLLRFLFETRPAAFDAVGAPLLGLFPLISMFLVSSITVLRERPTGTLERLLTMPLAKLDILAG
jgi:energy-coupling factor transporter ATP-binding protein EcfA2